MNQKQEAFKCVYFCGGGFPKKSVFDGKTTTGWKKIDPSNPSKRALMDFLVGKKSIFKCCKNAQTAFMTKLFFCDSKAPKPMK